nr:PD-(D/E)XK nuclease family protein [Halovenus carboxidivorans]
MLGVLQIGTLVHEWLEEQFSDRFPGVHHEIPITQEYDRSGYHGLVRVTGHADVYDAHDNVVYDWKTRGGWYKFDPPSERHLDQLTLYMDALDADAGQVVYLNKKNLEVRTWPDNDTFAFEPDRRDRLVEQAFEMRETLKDVEEIQTKTDLPFERCGCWLCEQEGDSDE